MAGQRSESANAPAWSPTKNRPTKNDTANTQPAISAGRPVDSTVIRQSYTAGDMRAERIVDGRATCSRPPERLSVSVCSERITGNTFGGSHMCRYAHEVSGHVHRV